MNRFDKILAAPDADSAIEEIVIARSAGMDAKEMFGGPRDWVDQMLPPIAFVVANAVGTLAQAIWAAVAIEVLVIVVRLVQRETLRHAFSGAFGVAFAAFIAWKTGEAKNFFLPGIVINAAYAVVFFLSVLVRKPIVGIVMKALLDKPKEWHDHPKVRRAMSEATIGWALVSVLRVVVQESLRRKDATGLLAATKIGMGWPLYLAALAVTKPYVDRRTRDVPLAETAEREAEAGGGDPDEDAGDGV